MLRVGSSLAFVAAGAVVLSIASCERQPPEATAVVALVDLSGSISGETTEFYATTLASHVWEKLSARDRLVVLPVDSESESKSEPLFSRNLSSMDFSNPKDGFARKEEREKARLIEYMSAESPKLKEAILSSAQRRGANRGGTDLIGAIHAARAAFPSDVKNTKRVLLVFSDMIQESRELNITQLSTRGESGAEVLAEELTNRGRIPELENVAVIVIGAGETGAGKDNASYFRAVRSFWKHVFSKAGAALDERHYGYRTQDAITEVLKGNVR